VGQDEHRPVLDGKFEEGSLQFVAIGELGEIIAWLDPVDRERRQLDWAPARSPGVIIAGVDEQPVQPGVEGAGVAQTRISRQAFTSASWTASSAAYPSRRIRLAIAYRRWYAAVARASNASWSPRCARSTRSDVTADSSIAVRSLAALTD
jgi:hypothetical protein